MKTLKEPILDDDYPVYCGYLYVADGKIISSDVEGTVRKLKAVLKAKEIRRCDMFGRQSLYAGRGDHIKGYGW